ncbi:MAG: hypothetical protein AB7J46_00435 [Candidatus Altimarinota bacterium]
MFKKFAALSAGTALLAMATVVPVMAQTSGSQDSDVNVDVNDYLTFAIANPAAADEPNGDQPFGAGAEITDLTSSGSNAFAITGSFGSPVFTELATTTNSTDGYNVTAYASSADSRTAALCLNGTVDCSADPADQIPDSLTVLAALQAANESLTTASDTGLALRVTDANTSAIIREADEDTQWGDGDAGTALWAALPIGVGAAAVAYDTDTYSSTTTTAYINWFVGVASSQQTGTYSGTVTFTASVN